MERTSIDGLYWPGSFRVDDEFSAGRQPVAGEDLAADVGSGSVGLIGAAVILPDDRILAAGEAHHGRVVRHRVRRVIDREVASERRPGDVEGPSAQHILLGTVDHAGPRDHEAATAERRDGGLFLLPRRRRVDEKLAPGRNAAGIVDPRPDRGADHSELLASVQATTKRPSVSPVTTGSISSDEVPGLTVNSPPSLLPSAL